MPAYSKVPLYPVNLQFLQHALRLAPALLVVSVVLTFFGSFFYVFLRRQYAKPYLNREKQLVQLVDRVPITHDTVRMRFALPPSVFKLGLPIGQHLRIYAPNIRGEVPGQWNGQPDPQADASEITRKYTPVTGDELPGYFDLIVKLYRPTLEVKPGERQFPDGGKMSRYLDALKLGDIVNVSGPFGLLTYHGKGLITHGTKRLNAKRLVMIAGGSGITPMLQIIKSALGNKSDKTEIYLLFANKTEDDILVRDQLDEYAALYPDRFHVWYTIDKPLDPKTWRYSVGYVDEALVKRFFPAYDPYTVALVCGPRPMIDGACYPSLEKLGWPRSEILRF